MKKISVNSISKKYEELYKKFMEDSSEDETFYAINNAMIFAFFMKLAGIEYTIETQTECYKKIINLYGVDLFFHNIKKTGKYKRNRDFAVKVFVELFSEETENHLALEKLLGNVLEKHVNRKDTGSYYTPDDTTKYMSERAIMIAFLNKCNYELRVMICQQLGISQPMDILNNYESIKKIRNLKIKKVYKEKLIDIIYSLKIIDPTCGSGAFITAAFEFLEKLLTLLNVKVDYNRILDCLYGLDISKEAVQLTKLRMLMRVVGKKCNLEQFGNSFNKNFKVADAIVGSDYVIEEPGFDWKDFETQFDCIIGNPPYVEASGYASENFVTSKCGNLYAYVIERACNISTERGVISFVVPLPFVATPRMQSAKNYLEKCSRNVFYGTYADRPGCIFTGVHQRLTIFFAEMGESEECKKYSSSYNYWYNEERKDLYRNVMYFPNETTGILPKTGNATEVSMLKKLIEQNNNLFDLWDDVDGYSLYLSTRIGFWTKAFKHNVFTSKEFKEYKAKNEDYLYMSLAILNSSAFYFLWVVTSDCWHITNKNISDFRFDIRRMELVDKKLLKKLVNYLMDDLEKNKKYIGSKQTEYEYKHKYSKIIIDQIDDVLAPLFDFNEEELEYIKHYTEKYRLNKLGA